MQIKNRKYILNKYNKINYTFLKKLLIKYTKHLYAFQ